MLPISVWELERDSPSKYGLKHGWNQTRCTPYVSSRHRWFTGSAINTTRLKGPCRFHLFFSLPSECEGACWRLRDVPGKRRARRFRYSEDVKHPRCFTWGKQAALNFLMSHSQVSWPVWTSLELKYGYSCLNINNKVWISLSCVLLSFHPSCFLFFHPFILLPCFL